MNIKHIVFAAAASLLMPALATAATQTAQLNVTATTVAISASIQVTSGLNFGGVRDTAIGTGQSSFNITVTNATPYAIALDGGANFNVGTNQSLLKGAGGLNSREFVLYQDIGQTIIWGPAGSSKTGLTGSGLAQAYTIYGKMLAAVGTAGAVSDVVTLTVTY